MESIENSVEVNAPVARVWEQWTRILEYPRFMKAIREIESLGDNRYRWRAVRDGREYESEFAITLQIPRQRIAWRTLSGVENSGVVCFDATAANVTTIHLKLAYTPDSGWHHPQALAERLEANLRNFKELMESALDHPDQATATVSRSAD